MIHDLRYARGRTFSAEEDQGHAPVALISAGLTATFWPGVDPVGRKIGAAGVTVPLTIVGVVRDAATASLWRDKEMSLYLPSSFADARDLHVLVRVIDHPRAVSAALVRRAHALDASRIAPLTALKSPRTVEL
jgi:hypothetical protein